MGQWEPSARTVQRGRAAGTSRIVVIALLVTSCTSTDAFGAATISKATTSRSARENAIKSFPYKRLTPEARERITRVVSKPSMFRRMPTNVVQCEPDMYQFLVRHPEVIVNIWQLMGITKVSCKRVGPFTMDAADGVGTVTKVDLIYGDNDTHVIYCEGHYDGPLFRRPLTGRCVLLLKSKYSRTAKSEWQVTNRLDVFLQVDHIGVDVFARTLHPLLGKSADINFVESTKFLERISRTSESNGPGMQRLATRLDQVDDDVKSRFAEIASEVFDSAQERKLISSTERSATKQASRPERR
ncbi:MAG: hypothetical protein GY768_20955 [Planctomycetaceae bacterium]|nr:hypothetical protein [Planctomycetaceae bacterium]